MTLETIIKLFHKAGASKLYYTDTEAAQAVARLIAEAENEACAKVCEQRSDPLGYANLTAEACAAAIRARKENT